MMNRKGKRDSETYREFSNDLTDLLKLNPIEVKNYKDKLKKAKTTHSGATSPYHLSQQQHGTPPMSQKSMRQIDNENRKRDFSEESYGVGANKVEVAGFVLWVGSFILLISYIVWAYFPGTSLEALGISYYPSRYWAISVPCFMIVTLMALEIAYFAINCMITENLNSFHLVTDEIYTVAPKDSIESFSSDSVPRPSDLSLTNVNRILYFSRMEDIEVENDDSYTYLLNEVGWKK